LRELIETDATERYASWLNDPEVNAYLKTREATVESLRAFIKERRSNKACLFLGVFLNKSSLHIGNVKLEPIDYAKKEATFGILIGDKRFWDAGYGTEVTKLIVGYALDKLGLDRVLLAVNQDNRRAIRAYEKAGFSIDHVEKIRLDHRVLEKVWMNVHKPDFDRTDAGPPMSHCRIP